MKIYNNILSMIGNTPMLELKNLDTGPCQLFIKCEHFNPGGSIKDRIALTMIEDAEKKGVLKPGGTIIEATAGNTGLGLALIANMKGYQLKIVMPDKMSREKIAHVKALGAEIIMTRSDVEKGHPDYYQDYAERLCAETENAFYVNQFANPVNPRTHEETTAVEIWEQMEQQLDAFVYGMGTSGTFNGVGRFMKAHAPNVEMILADPEGSILADLVNKGTMPPAGKWLVEGIGEDFVPTICDINLVTKAITVSDADSFAAARHLLRKEGLLVGSSTGTHLHAALVYCQQQTTPKRVVTIACDTGDKYLSKMFNDEWMWNQGFLKRNHYGDLRDLIAKHYIKNETITVTPKEPIATVNKHMLTHGISQLPVMEGNRLVGIVFETDVLRSVYSSGNFNTPTEGIMKSTFGQVPFSTSIEEVLPLFDKHQAIAVMDADIFLGIITPIDLINHKKRESTIDSK